MSQREHVIAGIREQQRFLSAVMNRIGDDPVLSGADSYALEIVAKDVEKELKRIKQMIAEETFRNIYKNHYLN